MDEKQNDHESQAVDLEVEKNKASTAAVNEERVRVAALKQAFKDDPEFTLRACTEGWTIAEANAEYCDVLRTRLAEKKKANETQTETEAIASGDTDEGGQIDFMTASRELAEDKKISVTGAMRQIRRRHPEAHQAFKDRSAAQGQIGYGRMA